MRIVLDTNCLIQSVPEKSIYHDVWLSFERGENTICITNEILEEYTEILQRLTDLETAEVVVRSLINSSFVEFITPYYHFNLITTDPDDNKFVDCAVAAQARYIVSNDKHFNVLKQEVYPFIDVLSLDDFLKLIKQ